MRQASRTARGLLHRRLVVSVGELYIGKESNRLEESESGLAHNLTDVLASYGDIPAGSWDRLVVPVIKQAPVGWLVRQTGLSRRTIQRLRNRQAEPRQTTKERLTAAAACFARGRLKLSGTMPPQDGLACLHAYVELAD
jgi:hypothetical protein